MDDIERLTIPMLLSAITAAIVAALFPPVRDALILVALVIAAPVTALSFRRERRVTAERESRAYASLDQAGTDVLTGTSTEAAWQAALDLAVLKPETTPLTVIRLEINPAETLDDGDEDSGRLLVVAAVRWQEILRPGDSLARVGPTEFAVLLPQCDRRAADRVVERLRDAVPDTARSCVGQATWNAEETPAGLVRRATESLAESRHRSMVEPFGDPDRLAAVEATGLAIREPSEEFDAIAKSVAWMLSTPVVIITLFDETWQHFIGEHGVGEHGGPREGIPAQDALCRQTVITGQPLVVSDTERHPTLRDVSTVRNFGIAACASVPIIGADGHVLGSICAMMLERHPWSVDDLSLLRLTARRLSERLAELPAPDLARV